MSAPSEAELADRRYVAEGIAALMAEVTGGDPARYLLDAADVRPTWTMGREYLLDEWGVTAGAVPVAEVWHEDPAVDPWCFEHGTAYVLEGVEPCEDCRRVVAYAMVWRGWTGPTGCTGLDCAHCDVCNLCPGASAVCLDCARCPAHPHPESGDPDALGRSEPQVARLLAILPVRASSDETDAAYVERMVSASLSCYGFDGSPGSFDRPPVHAPVYRDPETGRWVA